MAVAVIDGISTFATFNDIVTGTNVKGVIATATQHGIIGIRTGDVVTKSTADNIFNIENRVAGRIVCFTRGKIDFNRIARIGVIDSINAIATINQICTGAANKAVIPSTAEQRIITRTARNQVITVSAIKNVGQLIPGNAVIKITACQIFNVQNLIVAHPRNSAKRKISINCTTRVAVINGIATRST